MNIPRSLKKIPLVASFICVTAFACAQVVNQVIIVPANPTAADSILVISDFSYQGACSYGLVSLYTYFTDSTIHVVPTYCGYGDTSHCNSIDTFNLGTYPAGNYIIDIVYHQGSVCPLSGFDAVIAQYNTSLFIIEPAGINDYKTGGHIAGIYPNPAYTTIHLNQSLIGKTSTGLKIMNTIGETVLSLNSVPSEINIRHLSPGLYSVLVTDCFETRMAWIIRSKD